jgi:hypothetical protein
MDGDDKFILNLGDTANTLNILTGADTGMLIDGGQGDFNMGSILAASTQLTTNGFFYENDSGGGTGTGDVLKLTAAGSLDFTAIDDRYIRGIERLDLLDATAQTVTLGYQDIIEMTDHNNTLIISRGANDTVNVSVSGLTKVGDDISLDDGYAGHSGQYDVYSDGTVTLLVEDPTGNDGGINIA